MHCRRIYDRYLGIVRRRRFLLRVLLRRRSRCGIGFLKTKIRLEALPVQPLCRKLRHRLRLAAQHHRASHRQRFQQSHGGIPHHGGSGHHLNA